MNFQEYTNKTVSKTFLELQSSGRGISEFQAKERQKIYGLNEIVTQELNVLRIFLRQFKSPFFYLLFIAGVISLLIGERIDSLVILCFVVVNVVLGFFQEYRAERAVNLLKNYVPVKVKVLRNGVKEIIEKKFLVPGDVVRFRSGDIIPADLRIFSEENLLLDESIFSGEAEPSTKIILPLDRRTKEVFKSKNIAFTGTSVVSGEGQGVVVGTGNKTFIGDITKLVSEINRESVYERDLLNFSSKMVRIVIPTILIIFILNLILKGGENVIDFALFCVALVVTILPEALPAIVIFALSQGAMRMASKHVVAKRLSAVEDLGNIEILCTDKTGTLTENKLVLRKIFSKNPEKCLFWGMAASGIVKNEEESTLNPFDYSLLQEASKKQRDYLARFKCLAEMSFDHFKMRGSMLVKSPDGKHYFVMRGAPEVVLKYCNKFEGKTSKGIILREFKKEGNIGRRVLAIAIKPVSRAKNTIVEKDEKGMKFLGYFSFEDPLKKTAKETVGLANELGVKIKLITGDCKEAAGEIASLVGLIKDKSKVILGEDLDSLSQRKFEQACDNYSVFARVSPKTKYQIIKTLQKKYEVGFLGEGVNDAPALKLANVGIAVKEAVDISREASDIVLLDPDLRVVINGIEEGRNIFANINKYLKCAIAGNFGNFYSIAVISLFVNFIPMLPVQILLVNLLSDFPLIAVATDSVDASELRKPKAYRLQNFIVLIVMLAITNCVADLIIFALFKNYGESVIQTVWFSEGILTEIALSFIIRTQYVFFRAKAPSWPLVILSALSLTLTLMLIFNRALANLFHLAVPSFTTFLAIILVVLGYALLSELIKLSFFKWKAKALAS